MAYRAADRQALRLRPFGKDRSQHERRLRLHRKPLLRPWRRHILYNFNGGRLGKRPQHCRPGLRTFETVPPSGEIPERSGTDFQDIPILQESSQRNVEKRRPAPTAQIDLAALDRKIQLSLKPVNRMKTATARTRAKPRTKVTASPRHRDTFGNVPCIRRQARHPPTVHLRPSGKEAPAPEPAPRQFQHQRCHELVRQQTRTIGGIPKPGNKDDPDTAHTNKPKGFKL